MIIIISLPRFEFVGRRTVAPVTARVHKNFVTGNGIGECCFGKNPVLTEGVVHSSRVRTRNQPESPHSCGEEMLPVNGVCRAGLLIVGAVLIKRKKTGTSSAARRCSSIVCAICHVLSVVSIMPTVWSCDESKCV